MVNGKKGMLVPLAPHRRDSRHSRESGYPLVLGAMMTPYFRGGELTFDEASHLCSLLYVVRWTGTAGILRLE